MLRKKKSPFKSWVLSQLFLKYFYLQKIYSINDEARAGCPKLGHATYTCTMYVELIDTLFNPCTTKPWDQLMLPFSITEYTTFCSDYRWKIFILEQNPPPLQLDRTYSQKVECFSFLILSISVQPLYRPFPQFEIEGSGVYNNLFYQKELCTGKIIIS